MGPTLDAKRDLGRPLLALGAVAVAALAGCSPRLAGTNDAALEYQVDRDSAAIAPIDPRTTAARVKARLTSAQVTADVEASGDRGVRVIVDAEAAGAVDELILWRGGIAFYPVDSTYALAPPDTAQLERKTGPAGDGRVESWWEGPAEAVLRAALDTKVDATHEAFAERLDGGDWRTRVARRPALIDTGVAPAGSVASIASIEGGRAIALTLDPAAREALAAARAAYPDVRFVAARGRTWLATVTGAAAAASAGAAPIVIHFGEGIAAYSRADSARRLLESPELPAMHRTSAMRVAPQWQLATACAVLPFVLSFAWLLFVRRFDRTRPEPMWLVTATFALGGLAVIPAAVVEMALSSATPWLDPSVVTLGGQAWALPLAILVFTVVVGAVEEGAKWLSAWLLAFQSSAFDEPVDGIIYGCAASLGFAAVENVKYFALGRMSGVVIAVRAFMTVPAHMFFGAIWGFAMGRRLVAPDKSALGLFALAALVHGAFDATLSTDGMQLLATPLVLALALLFVFLLRHALRHGAIAPRAKRRRKRRPSFDPRLYFRLGAPIAFYGCAAAMIASALGITALGSAYELLHHRVGPVFVAMASAMLAFFGVFAYGASETIPLDAVVDARGLTFAGGCTPWSAIRRVETGVGRGARHFVRLHLHDRVIRLGPATAARANELARAIKARIVPFE